MRFNTVNSVGNVQHNAHAQEDTKMAGGRWPVTGQQHQEDGHYNDVTGHHYGYEEDDEDEDEESLYWDDFDRTYSQSLDNVSEVNYVLRGGQCTA